MPHVSTNCPWGEDHSTHLCVELMFDREAYPEDVLVEDCDVQLFQVCPCGEEDVWWPYKTESVPLNVLLETFNDD